MSELTFDVMGAHPAPSTAAPAVAFRLRIENTPGERVHTLALRCHVCIDARRRPYARDEQARLYELFGEPSLWQRSLRRVTWAQSSIVVPSFAGRIDVDLLVPCSYDLEVASGKYLHGIRDGHIPLTFLFTGTIITVDADGVRVEPVPWDAEASFQMPAGAWHAAMQLFFPGGGWLRLDRGTIDRLQAFRGRQAVVGWDDAIDLLLKHAESERPA